MQTLANTSLGLSAQALAVLAMLADREPCNVSADYDAQARRYDIEVETRPWFNGRERGVLLMIQRGVLAKTKLLITFGEARNSDNIFIDSWLSTESFLNPPTVADYPDEAYENRKYVPYGQVGEAVRVIEGKIREYMLSPASREKRVLGDHLVSPSPAGPALLLPDLGEPETANGKARRRSTRRAV
jgi:hypothetical protein